MPEALHLESDMPSNFVYLLMFKNEFESIKQCFRFDYLKVNIQLIVFVKFHRHDIYTLGYNTYMRLKQRSDDIEKEIRHLHVSEIICYVHDETSRIEKDQKEQMRIKEENLKKEKENLKKERDSKIKEIVSFFYNR